MLVKYLLSPAPSHLQRACEQTPPRLWLVLNTVRPICLMSFNGSLVVGFTTSGGEKLLHLLETYVLVWGLQTTP